MPIWADERFTRSRLRSSRASFVSMVESTDLGHVHDATECGRLDRAGDWRVFVECQDGLCDFDGLRRAIRSSTRLFVTTHGSNVVGTIAPIGTVAALAREEGLLYLVDAAQTSGAIPINIQELGLDLLVFSGHKGLLGPTGTGGLYVRDGVVPVAVHAKGHGQ